MNLFKISRYWGTRWHGYFVLTGYWCRKGYPSPTSTWLGNIELGFNIGLNPPSVSLTLGPISFYAVWPMDSRPVWDR